VSTTTVLERLRAALAPGIAVEREIARGGMGIVFLGRDTLLDRPLAIKVLKPELATATSSERFLREARHAAGLSHPNVVPVHYAGEADGLLYYTMDYIAGDTLATRLEEGRLHARDLVQLGLDLLAALGAAHRHKLIHRDVKPSNIFLTRKRALLGDFGVAHALDTSATALTQPGQPVGTLAYISPEQLRDQPVTERTDVYAVGLVLYEVATGKRLPPVTDPAKADWSGVPRHLRSPIRRALALAPEERWPGADAFSAALGSAERHWRVRVGGGALATGLAAALLATWLWARDDTPKTALDRDLAVFPFTAAGLADSLGPRLAALTGWSLEQVEGLTLTPRQVPFRAWRTSDLSPEQRLVVLTGERTRSRYGAWALLRPKGALLEAQLRVVDATGARIFEGRVTASRDDLAELGDSVADAITRAVLARDDRGERQAAALASVRREAVEEFLAGEEAFARDAWIAAEQHYLRAFELDSSFVLAGWRLGNSRRWLPLRREPPYPPGFYELYQQHRGQVPAVDRALIEAQFEPSGAARLKQYERALRVAGPDPYAPLLYGDELFHRGPLAGRPMRDAIGMLERAIRTDSTLAPAWEHLAWALIRAGDGPGAGVALTNLERWASREEGVGIHVPDFVRMAYVFRFGAPEARTQVTGALGESPEALQLAARGALSFELPDAQAQLGAALAASGANAAQRASGHVGRGVALVALGRVSEGQRSLDSAALLFADPREARLQAAEWRVVPASLGVPGWSERDRELGRGSLRGMTSDPSLRARASWALALDAHARGDSAEARRRADDVPSAGQSPLAAMLAGMAGAARGDWSYALTASEPALAYDSAGYAPDPFLRAALHLERGRWLERAGRAEEADRAWLWYENLDQRGWPDAEAQPSEVDWALGTYARALRARLALEHDKRADGCELARQMSERWSGAEPAVADSGRALADPAQACSP
jgi:tetratricopeptide (TPR) repeat protein/predicted Ser/Thr protein kinase